MKSADIAGEQINNEETVLPAEALYERLAESEWPMGMPCQPIDFDHALIGEDS